MPNKDIIDYVAPWTVYGMSWHRGKGAAAKPYRMAISSFKEEYSNQVSMRRVFQGSILCIFNSLNSHLTSLNFILLYFTSLISVYRYRLFSYQMTKRKKIQSIEELAHRHLHSNSFALSIIHIQLQKYVLQVFPLASSITLAYIHICVQIAWAPHSASSGVTSNDLIATSGDYLRLWSVDSENKVELKRLFNSTKDTDYCAPITSFDWNEVDSNIIGAVSIDTTCTIWDVTVRNFTSIQFTYYSHAYICY